MKRNHLISTILLIGFLSSMIIYFKYDINMKDELVEKLAEEYPLVSIDQSLEGMVTKIYQPRPDIFNNDPLQAYLLMNDSIKYRIKTGHELKEFISLDSVLSVGDLLFKKTNNDSILILKIKHKDTIKFSFQLRDDFGYPINKKK